MKNADKIRAMTDEELAEFLVNFKNTFGEEYEGKMSCLDWLQSEAEQEGKVQKMNKTLTIEYEVFKEDFIIVLSVVDAENDTVLRIFEGEEAEELFDILTGGKV